MNCTIRVAKTKAICAFVFCIGKNLVFSWRGSYANEWLQSTREFVRLYNLMGSVFDL